MSEKGKPKRKLKTIYEIHTPQESEIKKGITINWKENKVEVTGTVRSILAMVEGEENPNYYIAEREIVDKAMQIIHGKGVKIDKGDFYSGLMWAYSWHTALPEGVYELLDQINAEIREHISILQEEKKPVTIELPEGLSTVAFEMHSETDAKSVHTVFDAIMSGKYEFRSAVNIGTMVRTVMYEKGAKTGSPIRMIAKDKDTAWSLQQTIDWAYRDEIRVVAVRRVDNTVEVAYIRKGIPKPPPKEKYVMFLKKTDGWTFVKEPKR